MRAFRVTVLFILTTLILVFAGCGGDGAGGAGSGETTSQALMLDPVKAATHLSKAGDTRGAYWVRSMDINWGDVEASPGEYDWSSADEMIAGGQEHEVYFLAMVKPFASWDQDTCHQDAAFEAESPKGGGKKIKVGKPCDMEAYRTFLSKLVERYDGDGKDDMPGLKVPVRYWEIMNEPSMQGGSTGGMGEELKFFVGTPQEYLDILKASYSAIKAADPGAQVAHAGMAGMQQSFIDFWQPVFAAGAGDYFDIANIHAISVGPDNEDLFTIRFRRFLDSYGLGERPIWITEVQFGDLTGRPADLPAYERLMVRATVFSLAQGADKLFYIENWTGWDRPGPPGPGPDAKPPEGAGPGEKPPEGASPVPGGIPPEGAGAETGVKPPESDKATPPDSSTWKVYLNLVDKINGFDSIQVLAEQFSEGDADNEGATSIVGQYKFIRREKAVYVLWGQAPLPPEISGTVVVTDIYGESRQMDASSIRLSSNPVFVEKL